MLRRSLLVSLLLAIAAFVLGQSAVSAAELSGPLATPHTLSFSNSSLAVQPPAPHRAALSRKVELPSASPARLAMARPRPVGSRLAPAALFAPRPTVPSVLAAKRKEKDTVDEWVLLQA